MPVLRFAYALALALWLGGMIVLGAIVAPSLFSTLGTLDPAASGTFRWRIAQGVEMGRPSVLEVRTDA